MSVEGMIAGATQEAQGLRFAYQAGNCPALAKTRLERGTQISFSNEYDGLIRFGRATRHICPGSHAEVMIAFCAELFLEVRRDEGPNAKQEEP